MIKIPGQFMLVHSLVNKVGNLFSHGFHGVSLLIVSPGSWVWKLPHLWEGHVVIDVFQLVFVLQFDQNHFLQ
jgi:hypothetical protein